MLVKLKREIITMKKPAIRPELGRAPSVDARTLKSWLDRGHDDAGRPVVMLDTRNAFEVDVGTFDNALDYRIKKFSEFPMRSNRTAPISKARPSCRSARAASAARRPRSI